MKSIILVRHGKSSWNFDVTDQQRPLNERGKSDGELVVKEFVKSFDVPDRIYSSPANRALSTCKIFIKGLNLPESSIKIEEELYDFGGENVAHFIKNLSNSYTNVMIFGHNHAFTVIANIFGSIFIENLPTTGLVKINFEVDSWQEIKKGTTELILTPKELK